MAVDRYCVDCRHYSDPSYCYYHDGVVDEKKVTQCKQWSIGEDDDNGYLVIHSYSNGYTCGCCSYEKDYFDWFATEEEAYEFAKKFPRNRGYREEGNRLEGIYEIARRLE